MIPRKVKNLWARSWMRFAGLSPLGRLATRLATLSTPPYYGRYYLARMSRKGYVSPTATIYHAELCLGPNVFLDDRVLIFQHDYNGRPGGPVKLAEGVHIHRDTIIQTGAGGSVTIGAYTSIQPRCQFSAYKAPIQIGCHVQIAPNCAFYPYDHGISPGELMKKQPLQTKGGITIDDDAWLGVGVIVLSGVHIGKGAVVGAGSVVTRDIPDGTIAVGAPARVVKTRSQIAYKEEEKKKSLR